MKQNDVFFFCVYGEGKKQFPQRHRENGKKREETKLFRSDKKEFNFEP